MKRVAQLLIVLVATTAMASAQGAAWKLDKSHSSVTFSIRHMLISEVVGRFREFDIAVTSSKEDFTDAVVEATINVTSISTDNERRDNDLRSENFFNVEKFPVITFKSTSVEKVRENSYKIHGDLSIRDVTKKAVFDATHYGTIPSRQGARAGWKATLAINRFDYGLQWDRRLDTGVLVAGETVTITVNFELLKPTDPQGQ